MDSVTNLLAEYDEKIKKLQKLCGPGEDGRYDEIFLLRYLVSYKGDSEKSRAAINKANEWRTRNAESVQLARTVESNESEADFPSALRPYVAPIRRLMVAWAHKHTRDGQPLVIARIGLCNFRDLMRLVPADIIRDYIVFLNEVEFWLCDRETRRTKYLHKCYRLVDMKHSGARSIDRRFLRVFADASNLSEFLHPQLVGRTFLLNAPSFVRWIVAGLKTIGISKRALEKLWVHKPHKGTSIAEHPDVSAIVAPEHIPSFFGGGCECHKGCIPGHQNSLESPVPIDTEEWIFRMRMQGCTIDHNMVPEEEEEYFDCDIPVTESDSAVDDRKNSVSSCKVNTKKLVDVEETI